MLLQQMQVELDGHAGELMEELEDVHDEVDEFLERMNGSVKDYKIVPNMAHSKYKHVRNKE